MMTLPTCMTTLFEENCVLILPHFIMAVLVFVKGFKVIVTKMDAGTPRYMRHSVVAITSLALISLFYPQFMWILACGTILLILSNKRLD
jgi:hypothetical protein